MRGAHACGPAAALLLLAGCAVPPVLSLADRTCNAAPKLVPGAGVPLGGAAAIVMNAASPCVETPAGRATYAVFALPATDAPYRLTLRSRPAGKALVLPEATIYGAGDQPRRTLDPVREAAGTLVTTGTGEVGDRFLVVRSTPGSVGRSQNIPTAALPPPVRLAATVIIPIVVPSTPVGPTSNHIGVVLAHSGSLTVTADPFTRVP